MVKHNQLDVKGAPWQIKEGAREGACVPGRRHFPCWLLLTLFPTASAVTGPGVGQAHLFVPRLQDLASYRSLILRSWPVGHRSQPGDLGQAQWWWTWLPKKTRPLLRTLYVRGTFSSRITLKTHSLIIPPMFVESILDTVLDPWDEIVSSTHMFHAFRWASRRGVKS